MTRPQWGKVLTGAILTGLLSSGTLSAQDGGWTHWGADEGSTRYASLDQINRKNFEDLGVAWVWRGDNYGPIVDSVMRSTPIYAEGKLFGVAGYRRTVVAMDPATAKRSGRSGSPRPSAGRTPPARTTARASPTTWWTARAAFTSSRLGSSSTRSTRIPVHSSTTSVTGHRRSAGRPRLRVPPGRGSAADPRLHHEFLAADRCQRRHHRGQRARPGLKPDSGGERTGTHPGLRRRQRRAPLEVQRSPAVGDRVRF